MEFVGIDKFSLLDYDEKISIVLFSPACNFRCPFCHNGDSVLNCKTSIPFDDILKYLESRKNVIDAVVISGGEPTLMPELKEKIIEIKKLGYLIKIDTNGTNPDVLKNLIDNKLVDFIAMDIKNSEEKYPETIGCKTVDINKIKESIKLIMSSGLPYEFRTTLVKEFHTFNSIEGVGKLINGANKIYLQKFVDREGVIQKGLNPIDEKTALEFKNVLQKYTKTCELRGY